MCDDARKDSNLNERARTLRESDVFRRTAGTQAGTGAGYAGSAGPIPTQGYAGESVGVLERASGREPLKVLIDRVDAQSEKELHYGHERHMLLRRVKELAEKHPETLELLDLLNRLGLLRY